MLVRELKEICEPLGIQYECRWGAGFLVSATDECTIKDGLRPLGFTVKGIGIGKDLWRNLVILYVEKGE